MFALRFVIERRRSPAKSPTLRSRKAGGDREGIFILCPFHSWHQRPVSHQGHLENYIAFAGAVLAPLPRLPASLAGADIAQTAG